MLEGFQARNHHAELVSPEGSALGDRAQARGIHVHRISSRFSRISATLKISELSKSGRFDIVHANEAHAVTATWLARTHQRVPLVISRRVGYPIRRSALAISRYQAAARILPISHWVADRLAASGIDKEKMTVVYEGVEIPRLPSNEVRRSTPPLGRHRRLPAPRMRRRSVARQGTRLTDSRPGRSSPRISSSPIASSRRWPRPP